MLFVEVAEKNPSYENLLKPRTTYESLKMFLAAHLCLRDPDQTGPNRRNPDQTGPKTYLAGWDGASQLPHHSGAPAGVLHSNRKSQIKNSSPQSPIDQP